MRWGLSAVPYENDREESSDSMSQDKTIRRVEYAGSVHDEAEIEAIVSVLRGGQTA
ncbi:MAG: hypothetical protein H6Q33_3843, partial [Deltaproteobacteria bacterium]|nr:hypothetical protein [Deltaproteobacteria bacterium]